MSLMEENYLTMTFASQADGMIFVKSDDFKQKLDNTIKKIMVLKINDELENSEVFEFSNDHFLIILKSLKIIHQRIIFIKTENGKKVSRIDLISERFAGVSEYVTNYLIENFGTLKLNSEISTSLNSMNLLYLTNSRGYNLLMKSIEESNQLVFDQLRKFPFNLNHETYEEKLLAVDIAYNKRNFKILLSLLFANSVFPKEIGKIDLNIDNKNYLNEIKDLIKNSKELHLAIDGIDANKMKAMNDIKKILNKMPSLKYYFNTDNLSAIAHALKKENMALYGMLIERKCTIAQNGISTLDELTYEFREELRDFNSMVSLSLNEKHLMIHSANSVVSYDDEMEGERIYLVKEALNTLNKIPEIDLILKVTAINVNLKSHYDFNRNSVYYIVADSLCQALLKTGGLLID